jgi:hypothetical protein
MNVAVKEQVKGKIKVKEKIKKEKVKELLLATIAVKQVTNQMNAVAREKARAKIKQTPHIKDQIRHLHDQTYGEIQKDKNAEEQVQAKKKINLCVTFG